MTDDGIIRFSAYKKDTGLDHTSDMPKSEHDVFKKEFATFREQTDFDNENGQIMLKYYVQMAFFEGWKKARKFNIDVLHL